ncbi:MAG: glycosyltransferase family 2 protein, partial [Anaerolineae bacterium]
MRSLLTISVHIVTFNSAATLRACLEGLRAQAFVDYEAHVFDNASTDDTRQIIRDAGIHLVESSDNLGYAQAHNRLIDQTESTYVLTLNPDVYLLPEFLGAMARALDANPALGAAAGRLLRVDQLGETPAVIDSAGLAMRRSRRQRLLGENTPVEPYPTEPCPIFGPDGAAAFYRRAMLDDVRVLGEVFDSDFFMHKEDVDLCWRARLRGWESVCVPDAVAHHVRAFRPG